MRKLFFFLVLAVCWLNTSAQSGARNTGGFPTVEAYLASLQTAANRNTAPEQLQHLLNDPVDAVYLTARGVNSYGAQPAVLYADASAINRTSVSALAAPAIEMLTIKVRSAAELNSNIDLSAFTGYTGLKYVYILCTTQASAQAINNLVRNVPANVAVFYKISLGS